MLDLIKYPFRLMKEIALSFFHISSEVIYLIIAIPFTWSNGREFKKKKKMIEKDLVALVQGTSFTWTKIIVNPKGGKLEHVWNERMHLNYYLDNEELELSAIQKSYLLEKNLTERDLFKFLKGVSEVFSNHLGFDLYCEVDIDINYCILSGDVMSPFIEKIRTDMKIKIDNLKHARAFAVLAFWLGVGVFFWQQDSGTFKNFVLKFFELI